MSAPITALYGGLMGVLLIALAWRVVALRRSEKIGLGDGDHPGCRRAVRVHGNAIEYIPIILILMFLVEINQVMSPLLLHITGGAAFVARVLHALGLSASGGTSFGRLWGTLITWVVILMLSGFCLVASLPI